MYSDEKYRYLSDNVYNVDLKNSKRKFDMILGDKYNYSDDKTNLGKYQVFALENNQNNGMQAMADA